MFLTALWPTLRAASTLPAPLRVAMKVDTSALLKGLLEEAWKVLWRQTVPAEPSAREQEEEDNSLEENRMEEHWARGRQEEEEEEVKPPLPPREEEATTAEDWAEPRPWEEEEAAKDAEEKPEPLELEEEEAEPWKEELAKLTCASAVILRVARRARRAEVGRLMVEGSVTGLPGLVSTPAPAASVVLCQ